MIENRRSWVNVHLDRLSHNLNALRGNLPDGCKVMGVIKANAYGHGYHVVARHLLEAGCEWLAVSNVEEALSLRAKGVSCPILIFIATPPEYAAELAAHRLTQAVYSPDYAIQLHEAARRAGVRLPVHIKVDTGMSRLGFLPEQIDEIAAACALPHFEAEGIFTHFASADETDEDGRAFTRMQYERFLSTIDALGARGVRFSLRHCCNSAGVIAYPEMALDMVRPGIALYGVAPCAAYEGRLPLRPVMEWCAEISMVKRIAKGAQISYNRTFTAPREMAVATVPVGYADGFGREQSNRGWLSVRGRKAPILGRVCMDQLVVDVSAIPEVRMGDIAGVAGAPGAQSFAEMAALAGTIGYEKLCLVGDRVPRLYFSNGKCVEIASYLP